VAVDVVADRGVDTGIGAAVTEADDTTVGDAQERAVAVVLVRVTRIGGLHGEH
jgi:hypothetical protein